MIIDSLKWFFGFVEYQKDEVEGAGSWQHILSTSCFVLGMIALAVVIGTIMKDKDYKTKNKVLVVSAIAINAFESIKIITRCMASDNVVRTVLCNLLPLFLCSIQLIALPIAAFTKGRLKEASIDFVMIFGILGGVLGTVGAIQNYNAYPVFSFYNIVSATTHSISAFASLYIMISGMVSLKKKNMWITFSITGGFAVIAYLMNTFNGLIFEGRVFTADGHAAGSNYMFLMFHDGTPYSIFYNILKGNKVLYPLLVVGVFIGYAAIVYMIPVIIKKIKEKKKASKEKELQKVN